MAVVAGFSVPLIVPAQANDSGNVIIGDFEIDGNFYEGFDNDTTATGPDGDPVDWGSTDIFPDAVDVVEDPLGGDDPTVFDSGSKEDDLESWEDAGSAAAPGKSDVGAMYIHDRLSGGDQYVFVGFERPSDSGSTAWYIELNQRPNTTNALGTVIPDRSVDDVRIYLINQGDGEFVVERIDTWDGDSWENVGIVPITRAVNDSPVMTPTGELGTEQFGEFGFRLADVLPVDDDCSRQGFASLHLRSLASPSENSELKDYATGPIDIPSRCGDVRIEKRDPDGNLLGGATFTVAPDPTPGSGAESLTVTDNEAPDTDPADGVIVIDPAEPGDYTITETAPPPGYLQDDEPQEVTLEEYGSVTVVFTNRLGTISWTKTDADDGELICCATFEISPNPLVGAPADPPLTVTDNDGVYDTDPADGRISVADVRTGTYTVTETVPPDGYDLPADPTSNPVTVDADNPDVTITGGFVDPRLFSELPVLKVDTLTEEPLAGAVFELYLDDGDGVGGAPDEGDVLAGECTTGDDGTCSVDGLEWGTYYWYEVTAPPGYGLPADRTSDLIVIDRTTAGGEFPVSVFDDPQILTDLTVVKLDAVTGVELAGAGFVVREDDGDGEFTPDTDVVVDPPGELYTDASGSVTFEDLPFGVYWVEETTAPTGYELPDPAYQGPFTIEASNAGETVTVTFEDPQTPSDLTVEKVDDADGEPLAGAVFELYLDDGDGVGDEPDDGDVVIGECTTGDDGTCTVTGLGFGDYYWYEVSAPEGYDLPADRTSALITVTAENAGGEFRYRFTNPRLPGALTVLKLDAADDAPLAGATFDLVLDDGDGTYEAGEDTVVGTCTTNDTGTCTIEDLGFGTYFWVETEAPEGYDLPENTVSDPIVIDAGNVGDERDPFEFRDPRLESALSVLKADATDGAPLAGAVFQLYSDSEEGEAPDADTPVGDPCTTGDDGLCTVGGVDFGTYYWFEVSAPAGYDLPADRTTEPVVIDAGNAGDDISAVVVEDPRIRSSLGVRKLDETDDTPLAGALFSLQLDDGDGVYGEGDSFYGSCLTGDDGRCTLDDVDFGTYFWVEETAPEGYTLPDNPVSGPITVTAENAGTEFAVVTFHDPRALSELSVRKVAEDTEEVLAGAVFELYLDDGDGVGDVPDEDDVLVGECTTGDDGLCAVSDLGFGDYYWYETQAPDGYVIPDDATSEIISITAANAGTATVPVTFVDPPEEAPPPPDDDEPEEPDEPNLPDTGTPMPWLAGGAGLLMIALGATVGAVTRRRAGTLG